MLPEEPDPHQLLVATQRGVRSRILWLGRLHKKTPGQKTKATVKRTSVSEIHLAGHFLRIVSQLTSVIFDRRRIPPEGRAPPQSGNPPFLRQATYQPFRKSIDALSLYHYHSSNRGSVQEIAIGYLVTLWHAAVPQPIRLRRSFSFGRHLKSSRAFNQLMMSLSTAS